ncbi:hypothetical protein AgCh_021425 [Apium graveolens]
MLIHLEATDPDYLDVINDRPYKPIKSVPTTPTVAEHLQLKEISEWTPKEKAVVLKDAKGDLRVYNIYTPSGDPPSGDPSGDPPSGDPSSPLMGFLTLLNNLSLVGNVYDLEDSNTKFLRALNEEWETQTSIIRHQYDLKIVTLDEIYGMLRTHDLEVQQRKERKSNKGKSVALKVNAKASKDRSVEAAMKKNYLPESNTDDLSSNPDDDTDSETDENMTDSDIV